MEGNCWACSNTGKVADDFGKEKPCPKPGCPYRKGNRRESMLHRPAGVPDLLPIGTTQSEKSVPQVHKMSDED